MITIQGEILFMDIIEQLKANKIILGGNMNEIEKAEQALRDAEQRYYIVLDYRDDAQEQLRKAEILVTEARIAYYRVRNSEAFEQDYLRTNPQHDKL